MIRNLIVSGEDILTVRALRSTRNELVVSEPSVNSTLSTSRSDFSGNRNLSTVANRLRGLTVVNRNSRNNRFRVNNDYNLIIVGTGGIGLEDNNTNRRRSSKIGRVNRRSSTRNLITIERVHRIIDVGAISIETNSIDFLTISNLIPLIGHILSVRIIQVSRKGNFTIRTNFSFRSRDVHNRLRINIHQVFRRHGSTTGRNAFSFNVNSESVRFSTCIEVFRIELVIT